MELILSARNQNQFNCVLYQGIPDYTRGINLEHAIRAGAQVFFDVYYDLEINWDVQIPEKIIISVNGEQKPYLPERTGESSVKCHFISQNSEYNLFQDCYGFVRIEIDCVYGTGQNKAEISWYSDYLEVMIRQGPEYNALQHMFELIGRQHRRFLQTDTPRANLSSDLLEKREKTFERQVILLNQIQETYEYNLPFFKTNPQQVIDTDYRVRNFERLKQIHPATLDYMVQHPDLLIPTDLSYGIEYNGKNYLPSQTLMLETRQSRDCYENAVVMGFFELVIEGIDSLRKKIDKYITSISNVAPVQGAYTSSAEVIIRIFREQLSANREKLDRMMPVMQKLYWTYKNFLPVSSIRPDGLPDLTPIFLSVGPYRQVYEMIVQWFDFGSYNFRSEEFMLPFMVNSNVFEYYTLFKFSEALENNGFVFQSTESICFPYTIPDKRIKPIRHTNTFVFRNNDGYTAVLYYQPVISGINYSETRNNGIALRRTTTHSMKTPNTFPGFQEGFYLPDYVLKMKTETGEKYLIADAKFKPFPGRDIPDLVYKYAFSIHPASVDAEVTGIAVFYGKGFTKRAELEDLFDIYSDLRYPKFWITSLTESDGCPMESHMEMFEDLIKKLM